MPLRVAVTTIDAFRLLVETDWYDEMELIAKIKREPTEMSWQAQCGIAIHRALEADVQLAHDQLLEAGDYRVDAATLARVREAVMRPPATGSFKELRILGGMHLSSGVWVTLSGRLDEMWGSAIFDYKCKFSTWSVEDYERSLQWRYYLGITGARCFVYNILNFMEPTKKLGLLRFKSAEVLRMWNYPELERDCVQWLTNFLDWAAAKELLPYLEVPDK